MVQGLLVPDELVLDLVEQRLARAGRKNGASSTVFPARFPQAEALDKLLAKLGAQDRHGDLDRMPLDEMIERAVRASHRQTDWTDLPPAL